MMSTLAFTSKISRAVTRLPSLLEHLRSTLEMVGPAGAGAGAEAAPLAWSAGALGWSAVWPSTGNVIVGCSGGGRLNVVVGVHEAMVGGAVSLVWLGAGAAVPEVVVDVVAAAGLTASAGPDMLLNSQ